MTANRGSPNSRVTGAICTERMFEKSWQIKTHGAGIRVCPSCSEAEWRNIVGENDGVGTFQTPSKTNS